MYLGFLFRFLGIRFYSQAVNQMVQMLDMQLFDSLKLLNR